jgi:hypothetical protein
LFYESTKILARFAKENSGAYLPASATTPRNFNIQGLGKDFARQEKLRIQKMIGESL